MVSRGLKVKESQYEKVAKKHRMTRRDMTLENEAGRTTKLQNCHERIQPLGGASTSKGALNILPR